MERQESAHILRHTIDSGWQWGQELYNINCSKQRNSWNKLWQGLRGEGWGEGRGQNTPKKCDVICGYSPCNCDSDYDCQWSILRPISALFPAISFFESTNCFTRRNQWRPAVPMAQTVLKVSRKETTEIETRRIFFALVLELPFWPFFQLSTCKTILSCCSFQVVFWSIFLLCVVMMMMTSIAGEPTDPWQMSR